VRAPRLRHGGQHFVSLVKVIKTMRDTGRDMHAKYKETSRRAGRQRDRMLT
jgi:L-serine deaminase